MKPVTKKRLTEFEKYQLMRDQILENFDFRKCHLVMRHLDWRWGFTNLVPDVNELKKTAEYLLESAVKGCLESKDCKPNETYFCATGGFKASAIKNRNNQILRLNLEFILTDWDCDEDVYFPDENSKIEV